MTTEERNAPDARTVHLAAEVRTVVDLLQAILLFVEGMQRRERERGAVASKSQRRDRAIRFFTQLAQSGVGLGRLLKKIHLYIIDSRHTHARAHAQSAHLAPDRTPRVGGAAKAARHAMFRSLCMMRYLVSMLVHVARERYEWRRDDEGNLLLHRWLLHVRDKDNPNEKEDCTWVIFGCQVNSHHHTSIRPYVHTYFHRPL